MRNVIIPSSYNFICLLFVFVLVVGDNMRINFIDDCGNTQKCIMCYCACKQTKKQTNNKQVNKTEGIDAGPLSPSRTHYLDLDAIQTYMP